jgi:FdhD protein
VAGFCESQLSDIHPQGEAYVPELLAGYNLREFEIAPDPDDTALSAPVEGRDHLGAAVQVYVVTERPLTVFLNGQEIVTLMTIGDYPDLLAAGYLLNQGMLQSASEIAAIEHDAELETVVVRTKTPTNFEEKLKKKVRTSGCAQGTVFGDLMDEIEGVVLSKSARVKTSWLYALQRKINTAPSLYLKAGAIHGCVLCEEERPLIYMEDVGRHNAVDKIAGYMALNGVSAEDKIFYTTGRLTSEMVIKTVKMGIPILASRSGFTAWGVELARRTDLTLIGRMRGKRFVVLSGLERVVYDQDVSAVEEEDARHRRKGSLGEDL